MALSIVDVRPLSTNRLNMIKLTIRAINDGERRLSKEGVNIDFGTEISKNTSLFHLLYVFCFVLFVRYWISVWYLGVLVIT